MENQEKAFADITTGMSGLIALVSGLSADLCKMTETKETFRKGFEAEKSRADRLEQDVAFLRAKEVRA